MAARIADLRPWERNPRKIRPERLEALARSLEAEREMLEARPLIALPDGTVIAGNQRLAAAKALGWKTIPVVYVDLDEARAREWALRDNRGFGEDDEDALAVMLRELEEWGRDLELTGFETSEIDKLMRATSRIPSDPDAVVLPRRRKPKTKRGQVFELGPHRLMCGDATDPGDVAKLLADAEPVVMLTDPPYGVELDMEWRDRVGLNGAGPAERSYLRPEGAHTNVTMSGDTKADWSDAFEIVPSLRVAYVWHASRFASIVEAGLRRIGFEIFIQIIWDKGFAPVTRTHYWYGHEPCWYARKPRAPWLRRIRGNEAPSTVWRVESPKVIMGKHGEEKIDHPTQKPVLVYTRPIENHLKRGQCFYDPFAGSGTAIIAGEMTGRVCYAMELDPVYCDVIRDRYEAFVGG